MKSQYTKNLEQKLICQGYDQKFVIRCCNYTKKLINKGLPVLFDQKHISYVLDTNGMPFEYDYHVFNIRTENKLRTITAPSKRLKLRQRWILENILNKAKISKHAHGFEQKRSIKTNAQLHANSDYVICMDIKDFFPSVKEESVVNVFRKFGYTVSASSELAKLCCYNGALPQGAPTSPRLANIVCKRLDAALSSYAKSCGILYSRYADDLTFSSNKEMNDVIDNVTELVKSFGFDINQEKTRSFDINEPKFITGLVVQNGTVRIPKRFKRELKKEIHFCMRFGVLTHLQNSDSTNFINYREHLYGKAYYIHMIEPEIGNIFLDQLDKIQWPEYML